MSVENKTIAIIGGGPGGLTLARLLQLKGIAVKVFERDRDRAVRQQGATLDLHVSSGLAALEKAGLTDQFRSRYRPGADRLRIVDENGNIYFDEHQNAGTADFGDEWFRPEIDRGPLRDMLLDSLLPGTVVWDSHITGIAREGAFLKIVFSNGNTAHADVVIGADGANSKIRPLVTAIRPVYSGITILERNIEDAQAKVPQLYELLQGGKIITLGDSKSLSLSAKGDGSLDFYLGWRADEKWGATSGMDYTSGVQLLEWFKKEYKSWDDIWQQLIIAPGPGFTVRPQYCMPLDLYWDPQPNLTLLGDAAHVMPPYAGEGVNMAMLDALELSEALTSSGFESVQQAIAGYEKQMFARFSKVGGDTMANTEFMHSPGGLRKLLQMFNR